MKIIQVPFCYYPDPIGGTEVYVEALSLQLQQAGMEIVICAPSQNRTEAYTNNGLMVKRFAISRKFNLRELYGEGDILAAEEFAGILDEEKPDIVHLHAFTPAVSLRLVKEAKKRRIKVFFTYHTPTVSCQRGTLMYRGRFVCDGVIELHRCARCVLESHGINSIIADEIASLPVSLGKALGRVNLEGGIWTALRMTELIGYHYNAFKYLTQEADRIVAVCDWAKDLLIRNSVPLDRVTVIRHGISHNLLENKRYKETRDTTVISFAYFGRIHPAKGLDIIIKAIKSVPDLSIKLDIYGVLQAEDKYLKKLLHLAIGDKRIVFKPSVAPSRVIETLRGYDFLVVPSKGLETGPLVILEAFAADVPVIGCNFGGVRELVQHGVNGLLIDHNSVESWIAVFQRICSNRAIIAQLKKGIRPPRLMKDSAAEIISLYRDCLSSS